MGSAASGAIGNSLLKRPTLPSVVHQSWECANLLVRCIGGVGWSVKGQPVVVAVQGQLEDRSDGVVGDDRDLVDKGLEQGLAGVRAPSARTCRIRLLILPRSPGVRVWGGWSSSCSSWA